MNRSIAYACLWVLTASAGAAPVSPALPPLPDPMQGKTPALRMVWDKAPLIVSLPLNQERLMSFPGAVRLGLPPDLGDDVLRTQILDGTIYWTALREFPIHRIQVQAMDTGNTVLLDLAASKSTPVLPNIEVAWPTATEGGAPALAGMPAGTPPPAPSPPKPQDYATLTRMAAQHLYAPMRLVRVPEGVYKAPVNDAPTRLLLRGGAVEARPLLAWRNGALHVTAVKLQNQDFHAGVDLDPRRLRGHWRSATFQHAALAPRGDLRDESAVYLISERPFEEALDGR